ncbi:DNA polymerase III subunit delta [Planctomycetota bacterium]
MAKNNADTDKRVQPIYVIAGKETSLVTAQREKLMNQLLNPEERQMCLFDLDPSTAEISSVLDELRTLPFLSEKKVVLLSGADKFVSNNRGHLEKYFDDPCPGGILILTVSSWSSNTKLAKKLPKAALITVSEPKPWELPTRLTKYALEAHNKILNKNAAELIVELTGDNLIRLYTEIDKLSLFADKQKSITIEHIESLLGHNRIFNVFNCIDAIVNAQPGKAVQKLRAMFAEDRSAEFTAIGGFAFHFRRLFSAKVLLQKGLNTNQVAGKLRIWGNKDGFFRQLRKMTLLQIGSVLAQLAQIDYSIKTGQAKTSVALEQLLLKLTLTQK